MRERIRIGVIGGGRIARSAHLPAAGLLKNVSIAALAEPDDAAAEEAVSRFNIGTRHRSSDELFAAGGIDAVMVLTPKDLHTKIVEDALHEGLDVLVEKPIATTVSDARHLEAVARQKDRILMVGFNRRFSPLYRQAREHFHHSRPQMIVAQKHRPGSEYRATLENAIHMVDVLRWFGGEVAAVDAFAQAVDPFYEDGTAAVLAFQSGCLGVLSAARTSAEWVERLDVHGGQQTATVDVPNSVRLITRGQMLQVFDPSNQPPGWVRPTFIHGFEAQLDHFIACVSTRSQPLTTAAEAIATQELMERILAACGLPLTDDQHPSRRR